MEKAEKDFPCLAISAQRHRRGQKMAGHEPFLWATLQESFVPVFLLSSTRLLIQRKHQ